MGSLEQIRAAMVIKPQGNGLQILGDGFPTGPQSPCQGGLPLGLLSCLGHWVETTVHVQPLLMTWKAVLPPKADLPSKENIASFIAFLVDRPPSLLESGTEISKRFSRTVYRCPKATPSSTDTTHPTPSLPSLAPPSSADPHPHVLP